MDLLEYQGKLLFKKHAVPVPEGRHAATVEEAVEAAQALGFPVVVKAQVQIGGRGKAGGIKLAGDAAEAERGLTYVKLDGNVGILGNGAGLVMSTLDVVAQAGAFEQVEPSVPFVVRLDGTNDKEGRALLAEADLPSVHTESTMLGAAERVVELAG